MNPWIKIARLSRQQSKELQNNKLRHFINHYLYPFSAYYQSLFDKNKIDPKSIRTVADLARIPFTSKKDFIDPDNPLKFKEFILQPDQEKIRKYWPVSDLLKLKWMEVSFGKNYLQDRLEREFRPTFITYTTGTTNLPIPYMYTNRDINNLYISGARMLSLFNIQRSENIVNMFPYAPHLAFWQVVFGGLAACNMVLSTGGGKVMGSDAQIKVLEKMKPSVVLGVPSYVYHVLRLAQEKGCRLESVKKVVLGAAAVSNTFKLKLAELLGSMGATDVSVFGTYGFTEARCAWAECPTSNDHSSGYHLYPDKEVFEVIDPKTGEVKKEGEDGELVYTSIDSRASSVLRYRTGDFVRGGITYEPCPHCQRTVARISNDITRISDVKDLKISKIKGTLVDLNNVTLALSEFKEIEEWQLEIRKRNDDPFDVDEMVFYINTRNGANQSSLADSITRKLTTLTEVTPNAINFIPLNEMVKRLEIETANKEKRIIDRRPKV
jgi:phenylacetate-coenzyme A ligase PaaK-like adenylate-forming protein